MSILRILSLLFIGAGLAMHMTAAAHAEHRVALVVGNGDYQNVPHLTTPANDASLIADALKQDGFDVTLANNLDRDGFTKALQSFGTAAHDADWAVVYYAGHGLQIGDINYLVPIDAKLENADDVAKQAVSLDQVLTAVADAKSLRVVILDASRNDPFPGAAAKIGHGLAQVEPSTGTVVAFSTNPGGTVVEGKGMNSSYAVALAKHLAEPKVEIGKLFRLVRDEVVEATGAKQLPFLYAALPPAEFYFRH
jgi:uncharacterized caspase-like protein